jgi:alanine racemase
MVTSPFLHRPTYAEIDLGALERNFIRIRDFVAPAEVMPVVKANAYGHGLVECARRFEKAGASILGVAYLEEGLELRSAGIRTRIHVFGGLLSDQVDQYLDADLEITAPSVSKLETIDQAARKSGKSARVHLKIDTGLERLGVHSYSSQPLFDAALRASSCTVVGVFSHFAAVDSRDLSFTKLQIERFLEANEYFRVRAPNPYQRHIASSAGLVACPESHFEMVRPGLLVYGGIPEADTKVRLSVEPVMSLRSRVVYFKVVKAGSAVSYGLTWKAPIDTRVVTIPIGYGDGYARHFSNKAQVLIRGRRYPVVGAVCMDQLMVNLGPDGTAYNGDEVVLLGSQGPERLSVEELARWGGTIPWEVLVRISQRVPRVFVESAEDRLS